MELCGAEDGCCGAHWAARERGERGRRGRRGRREQRASRGKEESEGVKEAKVERERERERVDCSVLFSIVSSQTTEGGEREEEEEEEGEEGEGGGEKDRDSCRALQETESETAASALPGRRST